MNIMSRASVIFIIILIGLSAAVSGRCEDRPDLSEIKTVEGRISDIDWAGSKIAVKWFNQEDSTFYETSMIVLDEAEMTKGTDKISFSGLEIADNVTARYYEDRDGNATLVNLNVTPP